MAYKILCVVDDPFTLSAIAPMLVGNYRVDIATNGAEAIEAIRSRGPYAAVLSDLRMSGIDGAAFIQKAYELAPTTPRLVLTGYQDRGCVNRTVGEGRAIRFLSKPCSAEVINRALKDAVREYESGLLGRPARVQPQIEAVEIASPAALAVVAAIESVFDSMRVDAPSHYSLS